jgi:hypothetical protein
MHIKSPFHFHPLFLKNLCTFTLQHTHTHTHTHTHIIPLYLLTLFSNIFHITLTCIQINKAIKFINSKPSIVLTIFFHYQSIQTSSPYNFQTHIYNLKILFLNNFFSKNISHIIFPSPSLKFLFNP